MPALFTVPPTEFVTENVEHRRNFEAVARAWRDEQKRLLGLGPEPSATLAQGAFRGTEFFTKEGQDALVLYTALLFPQGRQTTGPFLRLATLLRQRDCVSLGSTWQTQGAMPPGFPASLTTPVATLDKVANRKLDFQNSYRFDMRFSGPWSDRAQRALDLVASERFAAAGIPVVSSLGRLACDAALTPPNSEVAEGKRELDLGPGVPQANYPARAHRVVVGRFAVTPGGDGAWFRAPGSMTVVSGVFGDKNQQKLSFDGKKPFDPVAVAEEAFRVLAPLTHRLSDQGFRITKREGRFVHLDRGRAYGLEIGTHLVSRSARLHVVQYAPWTEGYDVAIAMIRQEPSEKPLRAGDTVTFDVTRYPARGEGPSLIPLAAPK